MRLCHVKGHSMQISHMWSESWQCGFILLGFQDICCWFFCRWEFFWCQLKTKSSCLPRSFKRYVFGVRAAQTKIPSALIVSGLFEGGFLKAWAHTARSLDNIDGKCVILTLKVHPWICERQGLDGTCFLKCVFLIVNFAYRQISPVLAQQAAASDAHKSHCGIFPPHWLSPVSLLAPIRLWSWDWEAERYCDI